MVSPSMETHRIIIRKWGNGKIETSSNSLFVDISFFSVMIIVSMTFFFV